jgi:cytochrome c556
MRVPNYWIAALVLFVAACGDEQPKVAAKAATPELAQPQLAHKAQFKAMRSAMKPANAMFKGDAQFDLAVVASALAEVDQQSNLLRTALSTESPLSGDEQTDFLARLEKLNNAAKTARGTIKDEQTFREQWKKLSGNCTGCHNAAREKFAALGNVKENY